jgi:hypothetical protein
MYINYLKMLEEEDDNEEEEDFFRMLGSRRFRLSAACICNSCFCFPAIVVAFPPGKFLACLQTKK